MSPTRSMALMRIQSPLARISSHSPFFASSVSLLQLPAEVLQHIFSFLHLDSWGQLSLASSKSLEVVRRWTSTAACLNLLTRHLVQDPDFQTRLENWISLSRKWGVFLKRMSMLYSSRTRLKFLISFATFENAGCQGLSIAWAGAYSKAGFAASIHSFTQGWDENEFAVVLDELEKKYQVLGKLATTSPDRLCRPANVELRKLCRLFFWPKEESIQAVWLSVLLSHYSYLHPSQPQAEPSLLFFMLVTRGGRLVNRVYYHYQPNRALLLRC